MNSFIVIAKNPNQQQEYLDVFAKAHHISPFDITTITQEGSSIGIEIVRKVQEKIYLTPYRGEEKVLVISSAQLLTDAAQNALLKILEEPPLSTYIFLCGNSLDAFLPTVLSRCNVVKLSNTSDTPNPSNISNKNSLEESLQVLKDGGINERLALAESLASDKETLHNWLLDMTGFVRENMFENPGHLEYPRILTTLLEANKLFTTTNVNPRIILEHIFLTI